MTHIEVLDVMRQIGEAGFVCGIAGIAFGAVAFAIDLVCRTIANAADRSSLGDAIYRSEKRHNRWQ